MTREIALRGFFGVVAFAASMGALLAVSSAADAGRRLRPISPRG